MRAPVSCEGGERIRAWNAGSAIAQSRCDIAIPGALRSAFCDTGATPCASISAAVLRRRPETHEHALQHTQLLAREKSLRLLPTLSAEGKVEMKSVVRGAGEKDCSKCACWLWSDPHIESCYGCEGDYPQRDWNETTQTYNNPATCYDKFGETPISPTKSPPNASSTNCCWKLPARATA